MGINKNLTHLHVLLSVTGCDLVSSLSFSIGVLLFGPWTQSQSLCCHFIKVNSSKPKSTFPPLAIVFLFLSTNSSSPCLPCAAGPSLSRWTPCRRAGRHDLRQRSWRWCVQDDGSASAQWPHTLLSQTHLVGERVKTVLIISATCCTPN